MATVCISLCSSPFSALALAQDRLASLKSEIASRHWIEIAIGTEQLMPAEGGGSGADVHAYRFARGTMRMHAIAQLSPEGSTAADIARVHKTALVINAGFFWITPEGALAPTGWLVADGRTLSPRRHCRACAGVVYADAAGLHIGRERDLKSTSSVTDAVQVGPLLVEKGEVITFNPDGPEAARSAICLTTQHDFIVVAALSPLTLFELAALMRAAPKDGGLGCDMALNLDGGPSTQLVANFGGSTQHLGTPRPVQNFLGFFPAAGAPHQ